jgi:hypothetical protein
MDADQRVVAGAPATLSYQFVDESGDPAAPTGAVSVTVTRSDGTTVTTGAATGTGTAPRTYALTGAQTALLDLLTVVWTDAGDGSTHTTQVDIAGGWWASVAAIRASDPTLSDVTRYTDATIERVRLETEEELDRVVGARVPRFEVERLDGHGGSRLTLRCWPMRKVRWARIWTGTTATTLTSGDLAAIADTEIGVATRIDGACWPSGHANIEVGYEHGETRPTADLLRAFMTRARHRANMERAGVPEWASFYNGPEGGNFGLASPNNPNWVTGLRDVDSVVLAHDRRTVVVA